MSSFLGKSGADGVFKAFHRICIIVQRYGMKLKEAIDLTESAGLITSDQASAAKAFVDGSKALCDIFEVVAGNSGF